MQSTLNDDDSVLSLDSFVISTNITWYKFLTAFTCICSTFIYGILIWFLVCKDDRLRVPDAEKKQKAYERELKIIKKEMDRIQRINQLKKRFKYLITGKADSQQQKQYEQKNFNQHNNQQNEVDSSSNEMQTLISSSNSLVSIASSTVTKIN